MKKILIITSLLLLGAISYAAVESIIKTVVVKSITHYAGSNINRYDLGDVECFSKSEDSLFCFKK